MRTFITVFTFDKGIGDFIVEGIFTRLEDAVTLALEINPEFLDDGGTGGPQESGCAVYLVEQSRHQVAESIISPRLGQLYEPLKRIAGINDKRADVA